MHPRMRPHLGRGADMSLKLTSKDYTQFLLLAAEKIESESDYLTELDAATGDGDHWTNLNSGFKKLSPVLNDLAAMPLSEMFKKTGLMLMSTIGGFSGVLYGSAYIAAAKAFNGVDYIDIFGIRTMLDAMNEAIKKRSNAVAGQKTMIDALHPAIIALEKAEQENQSEKDALILMKNASLKGAADTKYMEAFRGRACYRTDKGVGYLDPGAVSLSFQIECLAGERQKNGGYGLITKKYNKYC